MPKPSMTDDAPQPRRARCLVSHRESVDDGTYRSFEAGQVYTLPPEHPVAPNFEHINPQHPDASANSLGAREDAR